MKKWIGIAAVLIVLLGTGLFFMQGEPEKTASSNSNSETAAPEKPDYVRELAENMTLEEKVGQMFLACVSNSTISREDIASYGLGGYLFFSDFFESFFARGRVATMSTAAKTTKSVICSQSGAFNVAAITQTTADAANQILIN